MIKLQYDFVTLLIGILKEFIPKNECQHKMSNN